MDKNMEKEIKRKFENLSGEERESFHTFSNMILGALAEVNSDAKMLKIHSDLSDEIRNIIDAIWLDLPYDKRAENEEMIKKFTDVMEQFLQICNDFKKENL